MTPEMLAVGATALIVVAGIWAMLAYLGWPMVDDLLENGYFGIFSVTFALTVILAMVSYSVWIGVSVIDGPGSVTTWWQVPFATIGVITIAGTMLSLGIPIFIYSMLVASVVAAWTKLFLHIFKIVLQLARGASIRAVSVGDFAC